MNKPDPELISRLEEAERIWLDETTAENVHFTKYITTPHPMRRHKQITGGLASLIFGGEKVPNGIYLGMITSDVRTHGGELLDRIVELAKAHNLNISGEIIPMKPKDWDAERPWSSDKNVLAGWYQKHGFRISDSDNKKFLEYP